MAQPVRSLLAAFILTGALFVAGCRDHAQPITPSGLYWPEGTPAELSKACKLDKDGKLPVEPCHFRVKPTTIQYVPGK